MRYLIDPYPAWLFIRRGFYMMISYRFALIIGLLSSFVGVFQYGLMARFLSEGNTFPLLAPYGGDLLAYLIIGHAFNAFVSIALNSFQEAIRHEQQMGTLEHLLMSPLPLPGVVLYSGLWSFINTLFGVTLVLGLVSLLFKTRLDLNLPAAMVVLGLGIASLIGLGLASAGIILVVKQGDPINWIFTTLSTFLSGVFFPVEYLPGWLQSVAYVLPTTHALRALRLALVRGAGLWELGPELTFLIIACLLTLPLGLLVFSWGIHQARVAGSLTQY
jgi:ABC-2 type transport system permease protein